MSDFDLKGFDELINDLSKAIKKYPDLAEDRLNETSKNFKKRVIAITRSSVDQHTGNLIKGFKLDKMRGYGINMERDFRGTAPHFHLIENGHNQVTKDGRTIGWVAGKLIVKQAREEYSDIMPEVMEKLLDDITRECDL